MLTTRDLGKNCSSFISDSLPGLCYDCHLVCMFFLLTSPIHYNHITQLTISLSVSLLVFSIRIYLGFFPQTFVSTEY